MTRNLYALLIGIDTYQSADIPSLQGCVNDVDAMEEYLNNRLDSRACQLHLQRLSTNGKDEKPTKQAIITGIEEHLCKATENDVALFYFSGHGSQESAPPEFWHLEPDRKEETLVCWDSRSSDQCWDLADKELAFLIGRMAKKNPHIHLNKLTKAPRTMLQGLLSLPLIGEYLTTFVGLVLPMLPLLAIGVKGIPFNLAYFVATILWLLFLEKTQGVRVTTPILPIPIILLTPIILFLPLSK